MWWPPALVLVALASGCLKSQSALCADGVVCPAGAVCVARVDGSNLCAAAEDLAACDSKTEGETCGPGRRCYALAKDIVCFDAACGNGFLDVPSPDFPFDEQCDDGNTIAGDGCSADCTSTERCGNRVIDVTRGETCDDGNLVSRDGCSSRCSGEVPSWSMLDRPKSRIEMSLAYDARRARVVMFGGHGVTTARDNMNDLWEWHGYWEPVPSATRPLARSGAAFAYDTARGELVMFGGRGISIFSDTHVWTGGGWVERAVLGPPARAFAATAYDPIGQRVVMFGGQLASGSAADDTWTWDGTVWTDLVSPAKPPASLRPSMAFDPKSGLLLLVSDSQTWSLGHDGAGWQLLFAAPSSNTRLVFDPSTGDVVAFTIDTSTSTLSLYRRGPSGWTLDPTATRANVYDGGMVADVARTRLVLVQQRSADNYPEVFEWDGASWHPTTAALSAGAGRAAALDTKRRRAIVFDAYGETWSFDARGETKLTPSTSPPTRSAALAAYDELRDRVVLFGGRDAGNVLLDDTWEWDGQSWTDVSSASRPPAASGRAMTYDRVRGKVILVGGALQTEMWEWDGTTWAAGTLPTALHDRIGMALGYDPIRERVVLFGGQTATMGTELDDTWQLEPTGWALQDAHFSRPAPRSLASLTWDASRRRLVLYGGRNEDEPVVFGDAWEWDGVRWYPVASPELVTGVHTAFPAVDGGGIVILSVLFPARLVWRGTFGVETCELPLDVDGDSLIGCEDPDCWFACTPFCPPGTQCDPAQAPFCGDLECASSESGVTCPDDCAAPAAQCGNAVCEAEMTTCPGDCGP